MNKALPLVVGFLLAVFSPSLAAAALNKISAPVDAGWQFRQRITSPDTPKTEWRPAQVPGDVHLDLLRNKVIPDPFYRENEAKLQWIETADWEYRTTLTPTDEILARRNIELVFEGLDAYSEVYLNGALVLTADNMFRTWRVNVKGKLKPGANELLVVFPSPITSAQKIAKPDAWRARTGTEEKTYVRKAAYEYGWDWGPRFVTSGIWRPVRIEAWDTARLADLHVRQRDITPSLARVSAEIEIVAASETAAEVVVNYGLPGQSATVNQSVQLHAGSNRVDLPIEIAKPNLWYPSGYGAQPLYTFTASMKISGAAVDSRETRTGLRSVVLRREPDAWGRSFEFVINGIPVFAKGANVIPFDSFPNRVTRETYRHVLESAKEANINIIRQWGGGYYETDEFYQLCDELGLMIWHDFMFGNDWQPGTYTFKQNVAREAEDQLKRLRNHPSIVLWCGNNETESAFNWATGSRTIKPEAQIQMWKDYLTLFNGVLGQAVHELSPETPYWPSSPSADMEELTPDFESGDRHDWSVWHGGVPFSEYEKHFYRFVSEYGFQSFPELKTVEAFTEPEDRASILTPVMLAHQKNNRGNAIISDYLVKEYGQPKDFASFLYASQVLQAEGIKVGAEHFRRQRPRTMGSIYWQLNDCWPVASWSSIDYFGRWKALHYYAKRFYAPLLVSPHFEEGLLAVYVVSDLQQPTAATLRLRALTFDGQTLLEKSQPIQVTPLSSQIYLRIPRVELDPKLPDSAKAVIVVELTVGNEVVSRNLIYPLPTKNVRLPAAAITSDLQPAGEGYRLTLSSPVLARSVYVSLGDIDAKLSENYLDLLPRESAQITIKTSASAEQLRAALKVRSLEDAFNPNAASAGVSK